jgi:hypothetical protein
MGSESSERVQRVVDRVDHRVGVALHRMGQDRPSRTTRERIDHEVVTVETLSYQCHVEVPVLRGAGVGGDRRVGDFFAHQLHPQTECLAHARVGPGVAHATPISARKARVIARSSNGSFSRPMT